MNKNSSVALSYHNEIRALIQFRNKSPDRPSALVRVRQVTSSKKKLSLQFSHQCLAFANLRRECNEGLTQLCDELGESEALDIPQKEFDLADKITGAKSFGGLHGSIEQWSGLIVGGAYLGGIYGDLAEVGLSALRAGWVPLVWVGDFPAGYLTIFPIPGRSAPVPKEWLVSAAEAKQARPVLAKAIPLSSFTTPRVAPASHDAWEKLVALPPSHAVRAALSPVVYGGGKVGDDLIKKLSASAVGVSKGGTKARPVLTLTLRTAAGQSATLSCQPPWTGSLEQLPSTVAQVLRHYNGMVLNLGAPNPQWHVYRGPTSGFAFNWSPWEINDRETDPSAWKRKPLAPFTNGQDLWVYHPARKKAEFLELVKLDHESDTWEAEPQQHPGVRFLQIVQGCLAVV